nr:EOG090X04LH [Moina brachiata]
MDNTVESNDAVLTGSIKSASYNMLLQIFFRAITFSMNGLVLHHVDKEVLGVINVRLMLLLMTILFISREAFRRACISNTREHNWSKVVNLIWLTVPSVSICSLLFCYIWLSWLELPSEKHVQDYQFAVKIFGVSCVIESFVEPVYIFSQAFLYIRWRLFVDLVMMFIRVGILVGTVIYFPECTIRTTAYGQLVVSTVLVVFYWAFFHFEFKKKAEIVKNRELHRNDPLALLPFSSLREFLPRNFFSPQGFDGQLANLTWAFFKQGLLKQLLTEGERYVMTVFSVLTFAEQGVYDIVNNLGSMAARFIFLPIEESSYFYFAQKLSRNKPLKEHTSSDIKQISDVLCKLLRALILIGSIIVTFGLSYSHLLLRIYGGSTLIDGPGPLLIKAHSFAVCLMAINGVTEAYAFAAMSSSYLDRYNKLMVLLSFTFLFLSWMLSKIFGSIGFIIANCCNMGLRIFHSLWFIRRHFQDLPEKPLLGLLPNKAELLALAAALAVTLWSQWFIYPYSIILHLVFGALSAICVLGAILFTEPELREILFSFLREKFLRRNN